MSSYPFISPCWNKTSFTLYMVGHIAGVIQQLYMDILPISLKVEVPIVKGSVVRVSCSMTWAGKIVYVLIKSQFAKSFFSNRKIIGRKMTNISFFFPLTDGGFYIVISFINGSMFQEFIPPVSSTAHIFEPNIILIQVRLTEGIMGN